MELDKTSKNYSLNIQNDNVQVSNLNYFATTFKAQNSDSLNIDNIILIISRLV